MTDENRIEPYRSWWGLLQSLRAQLFQHVASSTSDWAASKFLLAIGSTSAALEFPPFDADRFLSSFTPTSTNTATLGFLLGAQVLNIGGVEKKFTEGLDRCARQRQPSQGPSVHTDPRLLLGLSVGAVAAGINDQRKTWLEQQLQALLRQGEISKKVIAAFALTTLGNRDAWKELERPLLQGVPSDALSSIAALWAFYYDSSQFSEQNRQGLEQLRRQLLEVLPLVNINRLDGLGTAMAFDLASRLLRSTGADLEQTSLERLVSIVGRLPIAWAREKQPPDNEYDIQRGLWTMLAGIYSDLHDEQWLLQAGVYQPRADLALEYSKTIIEAKFIKRSSDFRKVQEEIIADGVSYTSRLALFDKVVVVIYDASSSQHKHQQLREYLERQHGIARVLIFSSFNPKPSVRVRRYPQSTTRKKKVQGNRKRQTVKQRA